MPRVTFLCHNFSQFFWSVRFFQNLIKSIFKKLIFYLINLKFSKSRTFESNTAPPHINNFSRTQGFKSRTNWRYPAHSGNSEWYYMSLSATTLTLATSTFRIKSRNYSIDNDLEKRLDGRAAFGRFQVM